MFIGVTTVAHQHIGIGVIAHHVRVDGYQRTNLDGRFYRRLNCQRSSTPGQRCRKISRIKAIGGEYLSSYHGGARRYGNGEHNRIPLLTIDAVEHVIKFSGNPIDRDINGAGPESTAFRVGSGYC